MYIHIIINFYTCEAAISVLGSFRCFAHLNPIGWQPKSTSPVTGSIVGLSGNVSSSTSYKEIHVHVPVNEIKQLGFSQLKTLIYSISFL